VDPRVGLDDMEKFKMILFYELGRIWKETVLMYFEALF
jgi:hypothetical protein